MPRNNEHSAQLSKDSALLRVFDDMAHSETNKRGVCQIRHGETLFDVCPFGVLMRQAPLEMCSMPEDTPFNTEYLSVSLFQPTTPSAVLPERAMAPWYRMLTGKQLALLAQPDIYVIPLCTSDVLPGTPGIALVEHDVIEHDCFYVKEIFSLEQCSGSPAYAKRLPTRINFATRHWLERLEQETGNKLQTFRSKLMISNMHNLLTLVITGDTSLLYISFSHHIARSFGDTPKIKFEDTTAILSGWEASTCSYAEVTKGETMKPVDLPVPFTVKKKTAFTQEVNEQLAAEADNEANVQEAVEQPAAEPESAPATKVVQLQTPLGAVVAEESEQKPEPTEVSEEVPTADAQAQQNEQVERKRTRTRKTPKDVNSTDLAAVTETLGSPVQDLLPDQLEAAVEEIRAIRDLQLAATRRIANLAVAIYKTAGLSSIKLEEVKALLAGK